MAFICPACGDGNLHISCVLELPSNDADDETSLQLVKCAACGFIGMAVYRENRRGSLQSESWHHTGYQLSGNSIKEFGDALLVCPEPSDRRCSCATHREYSRGDWINPAEHGMEIEKRFPMHASKSA